jgi:signal transduction histidine kinase
VLAAISAAGLTVCAAAVMVTLSGTQASNPALEAQVRAALIAAPIAVGLFVLYRAPWHRFATLLIAAGFAWSLTTLGQSDSSLLYSIGRVAGWFVEPILIYLVLAYPSGRLTSATDRRLVAALIGVMAVLYLPTALLVDSYPTPSPWSSCSADCPANAFMVAGSEPAWVGDFVVPLREAATIAIFAAVIFILATRIKRGTHLMRITLVPVLAVAILHATALISGVISRRVAGDAGITDVFATAIALSCGGVALGFMAGLTGWRLWENRALRRLSAALASHPPALTLGETSKLLSDTIDPGIGLFHRPPALTDGWLDVRGKPAEPVVDDSRCSFTEIAAEDGHIVGVLHDAALRYSPTFLAVARSSVLKALENERLGTELRNSLRELRESRARIMSSADRERRRIERDLHDGAQQSLVALRIRLDLASQLLARDPGRAEQLLSELATEVDAALEEVRSLARGVYPSILADRGLSDALRSAALRNPVPTTVDLAGVGRYQAEIEAATYFCCLEAMQNAMKHGGNLKRITVTLNVDGDLHFEVRDDGVGFVQNGGPAGSGLTSMRDRLAAVGGLLDIRTAPGTGTSVSGTVPLNGNGRL